MSKEIEALILDIDVLYGMIVDSRMNKEKKAWAQSWRNSIVKDLKQSLQPSNDFDVLMNNVIDEMTTEQQLEYYKEYYNLSRQQVADETNLESSRLRDEIISELNEQRIMFGRWNYEETNNSFISTSNVEIKVKRDCISNLNNIPLPLASKIIKYFELESE